MTCNTSSLVLSYFLDSGRKRERYCLESEKGCELVYGDDDTCYILDSRRGLIDLGVRKFHLEYHFTGKNKGALNIDLSAHGCSWGNRLVQTPKGKLMVVAGTLILPHSYMSVIQHYQTEKYDQLIDRYYTDDYYKLEGRTILHKFMCDPDKLEKIIDCYWQQNPVYLYAMLTREEDLEDFAAPKSAAGSLVG